MPLRFEGHTFNTHDRSLLITTNWLADKVTLPHHLPDPYHNLIPHEGSLREIAERTVDT